MVLGLRQLLGVFVILWLSLPRCRALDSTVLSWAQGFRSKNETLKSNQLVECETLNISFSPGTSNPSWGDTSYHVLSFGVGGKATMSCVGFEPSSLHWTLQHPAGTQFFVALFDSFGTSLGILPVTYTVMPGSTECLTKSESPGVQEATQPKISTSVFGRPIPCGSWEMSFSGGKPPYPVSIVDPISGSVRNSPVPPGEHILSYTSGGELSGKVIVLVSDASGMLGTMDPIIDVPGGQDTPSTDPSDVFSKCRAVQPIDQSIHLCEPPRPTTFRFRCTLPDHPHMQLSRNLVTASSISSTGMVAVVVCASLAGTGFMVTAIYVVVMYRRRQKLLDAQDTLPRPFEVTVHHLTSPPTLDIPQRIYSQNERRSRFGARRKEFSVSFISERESSTPTRTPTKTALSQSQSGSSGNTRLQPHPFDVSSLSNHVGPSSYRTPSRSQTRSHTLASPDPQQQSGSRVKSGQSSSLPTGAQSQRAAGVSTSRSASVRGGRSDKHALFLSHSASELYSAASSVPRPRVPGYGSHDAHTHAHRYDGRELHVDMFLRPTNHLRQWHSASPVVNVERVGEDAGEDAGAAIIFQHQDAGVMQELPPPYHKLVRSSVDP